MHRRLFRPKKDKRIARNSLLEYRVCHDELAWCVNDKMSCDCQFALGDHQHTVHYLSATIRYTSGLLTHILHLFQKFVHTSALMNCLAAAPDTMSDTTTLTM